MATQLQPRVAWVVPFSVPKVGGGTRHLEVIGGWLVDDGWQIDIYCLAPPDEAVGISFDDRMTFHRFGDATTSDGRTRGYSEIVSAVLRDATPRTVVYLTFDVGNLACMASFFVLVESLRLADVQCILRITSSGRATELAEMNPSRAALLRTLRYVALNPEIARELAAIGVPRAAIYELPNAVRAAEASDVRKTHNAGRYERSGRIFIAVCRFAPKKRLERLVTATVAASVTTSEVVELWLVGTGKFEPEHGDSPELASTTRHGGVIVTTWLYRPLRELYRLLCRADVYVSFSSQEGMSNALLEAMAAGLPVVVANQPANTTLVPTSDYGFLFEADRSESEEAALSAAMLAPRTQLARMGERNATRARQYDVSVVAPQYAALFRAAVASAAR